jgi:hypothetical protein
MTARLSLLLEPAGLLLEPAALLLLESRRLASARVRAATGWCAVTVRTVSLLLAVSLLLTVAALRSVTGLLGRCRLLEVSSRRPVPLATVLIGRSTLLRKPRPFI